MITYIEEHMLNKGARELQNNKNAYNDIIVDNPKEFIAKVLTKNWYITEIIWWDHVAKEKGSEIGYGGYLDSRAPDSYFFSETLITNVFTETTSLEQYYEYIDKIKQCYSQYELYPGFDIKPKGQEVDRDIVL